MKIIGIISILIFPLWVAAGAAASPLVKIPEGDFTLGHGMEPPYGPQRTVYLNAYLIDQNEVTNEEFKEQFPQHRFRKGAERHPVTRVSWEQADSYCKKIHGRLPTGEEWEKAARGEQGSIYPWGDEKPRKKPHPFYSGVVKKTAGSDPQDQSPYGVQDMAGSVWEWTADSAGAAKLIRGGLWNLHLDFEYSKTFDKAAIPPQEKLSFLGFRCVRPMD